MKALSISDVRNHLPALMEQVAQGGEGFIITRYGQAMASVVPFRDRKGTQTRYPLRHRPVSVAKDFDTPMPELWAALTAQEGRGTYAAQQRQGTRNVKGGGRK